MKKKINRIQHRTRQRQRISRRTIIVVSAFAFLMISGGLFMFFNLSQPQQAYAFNAGDYRARASGNWNSASTWQRFNGSIWINAAATPTDTVAGIIIQSPYTVTVTANVAMDQVTVNSGGTLVLNSGITMTVKNGSGTDLDVTGIFKSAGTVTINSGAAITIQGAGRYQHNFTTTAGTIPTASWITGSTCEIMGYTSCASPPGGLQAFSNFVWNCPSQTNDINLNGGLTTVNGNFDLTTSSTKKLILATNSSTTNIGGNLTISAGTLVLATASSATPACNITGNYSQTNGTFSVVTGSGATGTVNLYGNVSRTGGTINVGGNSSTNAQFIFKKTGTQTYVASGGATTGNIDFTVNSGAILDMDNNTLAGRNFTLSSGASLMIGATAGITSSGSTGNIQASGSRTYSTGANYTYEGTAAQSAGNGFPGTVNNLTVNNSAGLTISNDLTVSGVLTLTNGKLNTGSKTIHTTSNSTSSITGSSSTNYIVGTLKRNVSSSGTYNFPIGTSANYELISVTLNSAGPFTNITASFNNSNPLLASLPLVSVIVSGLTIDKMLNYGYWTLTPNFPMLTGTYNVTVNEKGATNPAGTAFNYTLLKRPNSLLGWSSLGTHLAGSVVSDVVSASRTGLTSFSDFAVAYGEYLNFDNNTLISGTAGQVNAIYKFPNVCYNVDAWAQVMSMTGGATLGDVDGTAAGYDEAWQPFVGVAANTTSSILWQLTFKIAGTSTDTIMPYLTITGVDVDGNATLHESVEATAPYSYTIDNPSNLAVTNTGLGYKAAAGTNDLSGIDTSQHEAMFQINYQNISSFQYRTGGTSTQGTLVVRQNCLYFKSFFSGPPSSLPIKLKYFNATLNEGKVYCEWATAAEINNSYFTIERSQDGETFEPLLKKPGAGNSTTNLYYNASDPNPLSGYSYYRLKQTDFDGRYSYSEIQNVKNGEGSAVAIEETFAIRSIYPNPFNESFKISFITKTAVMVEFRLMNPAGQMVAEEKFQSEEGFNTYEFIDNRNLKKGIYYAVLAIGEKKEVQKIIKN